MPRLTVPLVALIALTGCEKTRDVYLITETLDSNTCGANALQIQSGTSYRVQFEPDAPTATWKVLPKGSPITGSYDEGSEKFKFMVSQTLSLNGMDASVGQLQCTVIRSETLTGTYTPELADAGVSDGGKDAPAISGEHVIAFTADSNGSCRGATGPLGPFDRLPCALKYDISGEAKDDR